KGSSTGTAGTSKPSVSKPAAKPKNERTDAWLKKHLPRITSGTSKNSVGHLVGLYQRQQISPYTLVHDQHWGKITDQHYRWVHALQVELNKWKGKKIPITKTWDKQTRDRVVEWQKRNMGNAYKGTIADGVVGPLTTKPLGLKAYPNSGVSMSERKSIKSGNKRYVTYVAAGVVMLAAIGAALRTWGMATVHGVTGGCERVATAL